MRQNKSKYKYLNLFCCKTEQNINNQIYSAA